ncbi:MAG: cytochrome d ubiquinol oxidase subunit II, partial [Syntrophaceae bacterium]
WPALAVTAVAFLVYTASATKLYDNFLKTPALLIVPFIAVAALFGTRILLARGNAPGAFAASCATIVFVTFTGVIGLFPSLIPSSLDPAYSMTIYNTSSSRLTLSIMTVVALIFVPIVIAYKIWVYRTFSARVEVEGTEGGY